MTPADIIYRRRVRVIERATEVGVTQACREAGVSRTSYYRWVHRASHYGLGALMPKDRRPPTMPNRIPAHEEEVILAEAVARPTLGAGRLVEHVAERGVFRSASGIANVLARHGLATRRTRVAALAALTGADTGLVASRKLEPWGFCLAATRAGELVGLDCFYVGKIKGIGPIYQLTAVDTATRWAICALVVGRVTGEVIAAFVRHVARGFLALGAPLEAVLSDNGPEFRSDAFAAACAELAITHHRTPPRSPNHNAVVERFHGTVLDECYRPAFHRQRFDRVKDIDRCLQDFVHRYNTRRANRGRYMKGRTPAQMLELKR